MKVNSNIENLPQIQSSQATPGASAAKNASNAALLNGIADTTADQARLSETASQIALSAASPDVRLDKVSSIQNALQAGTYSVSASAVAKKVVGALLAGDK